MQKKKAEVVNESEIKEVVEFLDAQGALQEFKEAHKEVFEQFAQLAERYNAALEQAEQVVRARGVKCGPFDLYQFATKYNAEALYNAVGRGKFLELGGKIEQVTQYDVDKGRLEAAIAQKKLEPSVVDNIRKETPNFHKPDRVVLP